MSQQQTQRHPQIQQDGSTLPDLSKLAFPDLHTAQSDQRHHSLETPSIWGERRPSTRLFEPAPRRSRAGTLPSRLTRPQGIGSLALLDPVPTIVEPPSVSPQGQAPQPQVPSQAVPIPPVFQRSPNLTPEVTARSRSGSMSASYSPFGPSIWSSPFTSDTRARANTVSHAGQVPSLPAIPQPQLAPVPPAGASQARDTVSIDDLSPVPTNSLWVSNVPANAPGYALQALFAPYGRVEASRVFGYKQCACVTFASAAAAADAQRQTNGCELFPGRGPALVGFAKTPSVCTNSAAPGAAAPSTTTIPPVASGAATPAGLLAMMSLLETTPVPDEIELIQRAFAYGDSEKDINSPPEQINDRVYISAVLRDIRKRIDNKQISRLEIEEIALDMISELPTLTSDYMGNTVVQQLFDQCQDDIKDMLLRTLVPHLAQAGVHKNGTWAVQKIIDVATTSRHCYMIVKALRPYAVPLFLDQYGNYVIQCCLKFGAPYSDFIFETIVANLPEISHGRFGARAIRACLESTLITRAHQRVVAAAIVDNIAQLALNPNGSLLVTWLLDSYTCSPNRYAIVTQRFASSLVQMCTSKVASLTVLKIITTRVDSASSRMLLDLLFDPTSEYPPEALKQILGDPHGNGPMFLYKLLTTGFAENSLDRHVAVNKIRNLLLAPNAPAPNHKRLLEEVGLSMLFPDDGQQARSTTPPAPVDFRLGSGNDCNLNSHYSDWVRY